MKNIDMNEMTTRTAKRMLTLEKDIDFMKKFISEHQDIVDMHRTDALEILKQEAPEEFVDRYFNEHYGILANCKASWWVAKMKSYEKSLESSFMSLLYDERARLKELEGGAK